MSHEEDWWEELEVFADSEAVDDEDITAICPSCGWEGPVHEARVEPGNERCPDCGHDELEYRI